MKCRFSQRIWPALFSLSVLIWPIQQAEAQSAQDIQAAKTLLQKIGVNIGSALGAQATGSLARSIAAFEGEIENPELAFKHGLGLADPRPTPVQSGTKFFLTIGQAGKLTFYIDDKGFLRDADNQPTDVKVNKDLLPDGIAVVNSFFGSR